MGMYLCISKSVHLYQQWVQRGLPGARYNRSKSWWFWNWWNWWADETTFADWFFVLMLPNLGKQDGKKVLIGNSVPVCNGSMFKTRHCFFMSFPQCYSSSPIPRCCLICTFEKIMEKVVGGLEKTIQRSLTQKCSPKGRVQQTLEILGG